MSKLWSTAALAVAVVAAVPARAPSQGPPAPTVPRYDIRGIVRDSASGETLPYATVTLRERRYTAQTNSDGRFAFARVPAGRYTLQVQAMGYRPAIVSVESGDRSAIVVVALVAASARLQAVTIEGAPTAAVEVAHDISQLSLAPAQIATLPSLGETDIFRGLQLLPGVSAAQDGSSGLYVRGGTPDENLVLLDGMTVYHVDHFFGLFSAFNADAIKDVRIYKGAFPAKYGGRTSSVVDLTGKTGDEQQLRATAGANLLSARAVAEIPLGRGSWLVSGRRSYTDLVQSSLYNRLFGFRRRAAESADPATTGGRVRTSAQQEPPFYFYDFNTKLSYRPSESDLVALSGYRGEDNLDQGQTFAAPPGWTGAPPRNIDVTAWGNVGASARWMRQWRGGLASDLLVSATRYRSSAERGSIAGDATVATRERNEVEDVTLRLDNTLPLGRRLALDFGVWATSNDVSYEQADVRGDSAERSVAQDTRGTQRAAYASATWHPARRLELTVGERATAFSPTSATYWEPRASLRFELGARAALKAGWGRHHQFVSRVDNEDILRGSRDFWLLADSARPPSSAEHRIIGVTLEGARYLLDVEAYDKVLGGVTQFSRRVRRPNVTGADAFFFTGDGSARGVEVLVQRKAGSLTGWATYAFNRIRLRFPDFDGGDPFPASHEQRHQLKLVGSWERGGWTLSSSWIYGTGRPYTAPESQYAIRLLDGTTSTYVHVGDRNGARLPDYHRLDLAATRRIEIGRARLDVGLSVFNAYNRANIWYRKFDLAETPITVTDVTMLGFTPSIDVRLSWK
jgi:ferric enterobactin receptor